MEDAGLSLFGKMMYAYGDSVWVIHLPETPECSKECEEVANAYQELYDE